MEEKITLPEVTPTPEVSVQPPKKNDLSKVVILLIVILLVGAGGVYAGVQIGKRQVAGGLLPSTTPTLIPQPTEIPTTPDETANWKIYRNEKYGFEFRYPEGWVIEEASLGDLVVVLDPLKVSLKENLRHALDNINGLIEVRASDKKNSLIFGWDTFKKETIGVDNVRVRKSEERTSSNESNPAYVNKHIITYFLEDKGIVFSYISDFEDKYLSQFDQILSTFKFLD